MVFEGQKKATYLHPIIYKSAIFCINAPIAHDSHSESSGFPLPKGSRYPWLACWFFNVFLSWVLPVAILGIFYCKRIWEHFSSSITWTWELPARTWAIPHKTLSRKFLVLKGSLRVSWILFHSSLKNTCLLIWIFIDHRQGSNSSFTFFMWSFKWFRNVE